MSERSEREREAARLERERRRAEREGRAVPPVVPDAPEAEPVAPEPVVPEPAAPEPAAAEPPLPEPAPPAREEGPPTRVRRIPPDPAAAAAAGLRAVPAHPDADGGPPDTTPGPQPGAPGMPRHPLSVPSRRRRRRSPARVALIGGLIALLLIAVAFVVISIYTPFKGDGSGRVVVTIPAGSSAREVGNLLADKGVVGSGLFFSLRAAIGGDRDKLRAGRFVLRRDMSNGAAITVLTTPPKVAPVQDLVIPEGPSRREVAPLVEKAGVPGDYLAASKRSATLNPRDYGAPRATPSLEGFLFPATYRIRRGTTARTLVAQQLQAYKDNTAGVSYRRAKRKNLTRYDVLIIASMIERETAVARERRLISGVIYNRLKQGIPLGIDATTRYDENNWTKPLTNAELGRDSPFNTRRNKGLPPTPIGNPGLASIRAAARPASTKALFYVVKPCANGAHAFSRTDAEFQADVAAYNRKRAELGGKDPSTCPR